MIRTAESSTQIVPVAFYICIGETQWDVKFLEGIHLVDGQDWRLYLDRDERTLYITPQTGHLHEAAEKIDRCMTSMYYEELERNPLMLPPPRITTAGITRVLKPRVDAAAQGIETDPMEYIPDKVLHYHQPSEGKGRYCCPFCNRKPYRASNGFFNHLENVHGVSDYAKWYVVTREQQAGLFDYLHPRIEPAGKKQAESTFDTHAEDDCDRGEDWKYEAA